MSGPLIIALPSKGRLQEDAEAWLADAGFVLRRDGGDRAYVARLRGLDDALVRLLSAREIAAGLGQGDFHLGVCGEDLVREETDGPGVAVHLLHALGFGRADLIVAVPQGWIDVETMTDLGAVAARERARCGRPLRVATKYPRLTRRFFADAGIADYRLVESHGATEAAPAARLADIITDITTTGRTLAANHLKILSDGVILRSEARLVGSLAAPWSAAQRTALERLCDGIEARAAGRSRLRVSAGADSEAMAAVAARHGATVEPGGHAVICERAAVHAVCRELRDIGGGPVSAAPVAYMFAETGGAASAFEAVLDGRRAAE